MFLVVNVWKIELSVAALTLVSSSATGWVICETKGRKQDEHLGIYIYSNRCIIYTHWEYSQEPKYYNRLCLRLTDTLVLIMGACISNADH